MIDVPATLDRVLRLSNADACIAIARRRATVNVRWANNTVTTNGAAEQISLSVISIRGRRVGSVTRTYFPAESLEAIVRESEAACDGTPEAPDYEPLLEGYGPPVDWEAPPADTDIRVFDAFAPALRDAFEQARQLRLLTFGFAEHGASTVWLATSTGVRRRYADRIGKVEMTGKTPDFERSSWVGRATEDFRDVDPQALLGTLQQRLAWSERRLELPAGHYEVLFEPSCTADMALGAYGFMNRRDADEGRSPYSSPDGGTRLGQRLFGDVTMYSDPREPGVSTTPFQVTTASSGDASVFDNGLPIERTDWVRDGELRALVAPRYWASKIGAPDVASIDNLIVQGDGVTTAEMIAQTKRALLVTCLWYIRIVDPQTALLTGLTRDGVFLIENGEVIGAVNNFRWNMSPIAALAQVTQIGRTDMALPREADEFLRSKAPAVRIERFHMSSVSEAV